MARQYFGAESPIGRRISGAEVIGVARDTKYTSLRDPAQRMIYTPVGRGWAVADVRFALHTDRSVSGIGAAIRQAIANAGIAKKATAIESIAEISDATLARERLLAEVATSFGLLALALACIGLYGTMSFAVARRTSEIALRMALGANRATIIGQLMRESGTTVVLGAGAGLAGTFAMSRLFRACCSASRRAIRRRLARRCYCSPRQPLQLRISRRGARAGRIRSRRCGPSE